MRIFSLYPRVKIIALLREPVARAYSHWNMIKQQHVTRGTGGSFVRQRFSAAAAPPAHTLVSHQASMLVQSRRRTSGPRTSTTLAASWCVARSGGLDGCPRSSASDVTNSARHQVSGRYILHLQRYEKLFPRSALNVFIYEDGPPAALGQSPPAPHAQAVVV